MNKLLKYIAFIVFTITINSINAQEKYFTRAGSIGFEASVPSFEEVKAQSNTVSAVLNIHTGEIASLALVKGFRFKVALMEEHFNESYAETNRFPKATFSGKIKDFSIENLSENPMLFELIGNLNFHGKTVEIDPDVSISLNKETIYLKN